MGQVVDCRHELATNEVPRNAEQYKRYRCGRVNVIQAFAERVLKFEIDHKFSAFSISWFAISW